jgi:hypothetical protein
MTYPGPTEYEGAWSDRSASIEDLSAALVKALGEMRDITKGQKANAGTYSYTYADLAAVLEVARPALAKHGCAVTQTAETSRDSVTVWTTVLHTSGQFVTSKPVRFPPGATPQQTGSAVTYARRYGLMAMLGLAAEDDDGQQAAAAPEKSFGTFKTPSGKTVSTGDAKASEKQVAFLRDRMHHASPGVGSVSHAAAASNVVGRTVLTLADLTKAEVSRLLDMSQLELTVAIDEAVHLGGESA